MTSSADIPKKELPDAEEVKQKHEEDSSGLSTTESNATNSNNNNSVTDELLITKQLPMNDLLTKISIHRGNIVDMNIDAVVNAANGGLWAGAGVCGVIFRAAGYRNLNAECTAIINKRGKIKTGKTVITKGYNLPAKYILHTVGPTSENALKLRSCYYSCLTLCVRHNIRSVAFPCVSTGVFGFRKEVAWKIAMNAVKDWMMEAQNVVYKNPQNSSKKTKEKNETNDENTNGNPETIAVKEESYFDRIDDIIFCCYDIGNWRLYKKYISVVFPSNGKHNYLWSHKQNVATTIQNDNGTKL